MSMGQRRFGGGVLAGLLAGLLIVFAGSASSIGLFGSTTPNDQAGGVVFKAIVSTTTSAPGSQLQSMSSGLVPSLSSHVAGISQQQPASNLIVFLPLAVAFLLGAVLYVSSRRRAKEPGDDESAG
jgi:predicted lipid-binding transport protein (Tim44 family)